MKRGRRTRAFERRVERNQQWLEVMRLTRRIERVSEDLLRKAERLREELAKE